MKKIILLLVAGVVLTIGCSKNSYTDIGVCDKSLFETVDEKGTIRISITLKMSYVPEDEDELINKVERIQDEFIQILKDLDFNVTGIKKLEKRPRMAMSVDKETLTFICKSDKVEVINEDIPDSTQ